MLKTVKKIPAHVREKEIRIKLRSVDKMLANITATHLLWKVLTEKRDKMQQELLDILKEVK